MYRDPHVSHRPAFEREELKELFSLVVAALAAMLALPDDVLSMRQNVLQRLLSLSEQVTRHF